VIFGYIDRAVGGLAERSDAELKAVVGPGFLLDGKDLSELRPRRLQPGFSRAGDNLGVTSR
jgi:hypothetical protein